MELDEIDEQLVRALQRDGRASWEALAREVGLARSTTKARVRRLVDECGLRLVGAVHPGALDLNQMGHVTVEVAGPALPVAEQLAALVETSFVTTTAGRFAVTAELRTTDLDAFQRGLSRVQAVPGVLAVQVLTYTHLWKDPYFPPGPLSASGSARQFDLDAADHALLSRLRVDGRASFAELAEVSGLSPGATRARVLRLLGAGVLHIGALVRLTPLSRVHTAGFAVSLGGATEGVAEHLTAIDEVDSFAEGIGWCNGIGSIRAGSQEAVFATLERIRALPKVRALESWTHLRAVKEEHDLAHPLTT
ncbi:transcriptional regulator [Saccharomonospora cyanea NA-134]|uniref:Transcriptional regulator n=1 Tax=Saccharomonospora cyanea NA-134 TaxID=882082 RepID=H5XJA3_9PSEU|nr:transcriptional regulator [Saccharomonospora cyanea NA-134]